MTVWAVNADLFPDAAVGALDTAAWVVSAALAPTAALTGTMYGTRPANATLSPTAALTGTMKGLRPVSAAFLPTAALGAMLGEHHPISVVIAGVASVTAAAHKIKNVFAHLDAEATIFVNASQFKPARPAKFTPPFVPPRVRAVSVPTPHLSVTPPRRGQVG